MSSNTMIAALTAKGYVATGMGGNIMLMTKYVDGKTIVVSDADRDGLPSEDDWGIGVYNGDFMQDQEAECIDCTDSECSPVHFELALDLCEAN